MQSKDIINVMDTEIMKRLAADDANASESTAYYRDRQRVIVARVVAGLEAREQPYHVGDVLAALSAGDERALLPANPERSHMWNPLVWSPRDVARARGILEKMQEER